MSEMDESLKRFHENEYIVYDAFERNGFGMMECLDELRDFDT